MDNLLSDLRTAIGETNVIADRGAMGPYLTDWRRAFHGSAVAVLLPRSTAQVASVLRACASRGVCVVPQGGNTGLAGGATPDASGQQVVLSLARMQAVRRVDRIGMTIELEAGISLAEARRLAAAEGLELPISIASEGTATIGGIISTNAGGVHVVRHGMTREWVLGLEVVLADGTCLDGLRHLRKNNAGLDWKQLFVGTEGALGIVTAAVLRMAPPLRQRHVALLAVADLATVLGLFNYAMARCGEALTAFELMSEQSVELVARNVGLTPPVNSSGWFVLIELASSLPGLATAFEDLVGEALELGLILDGSLATSERQAAELWALRENITLAEATSGPSLKHDISVPISAIPQFVASFEGAMSSLDPNARTNVFGHVGDGNLHANVVGFSPTKATAITQKVHDLAWSLGGSITAEHGLGQYRLSEYQRLAPMNEQELLRRIKRSLDPAGLLNRGKAFPLIPDGHRA
ncbi:FAD-binding oxidoreductase [Tabrizicola sp. J26]|uniref:FAD-binding oxidoreductase n=1 Tax=Alitabrizicola rongguiensis TaxID=2909234 RepID=UPI001F440C7C|nr:FAD-binding oxidoreductase [Tabrizicola rongguiensis]MCF1709408.1 FAD-binding oxidoreductase [Tabrizicola rongguiensis]